MLSRQKVADSVDGILYGWPVSPADCLLTPSRLLIDKGRAQSGAEQEDQATAGLIHLIYDPSSPPIVTKPRHLSNDNEQLLFWFGG